MCTFGLSGGVDWTLGNVLVPLSSAPSPRSGLFDDSELKKSGLLLPCKKYPAYGMNCPIWKVPPAAGWGQSDGGWGPNNSGLVPTDTRFIF